LSGVSVAPFLEHKHVASELLAHKEVDGRSCLVSALRYQQYSSALQIISHDAFPDECFFAERTDCVFFDDEWESDGWQGDGDWLDCGCTDPEFHGKPYAYVDYGRSPWLRSRRRVGFTVLHEFCACYVPDSLDGEQIESNDNSDSDSLDGEQTESNDNSDSVAAAIPQGGLDSFLASFDIALARVTEKCTLCLNARDKSRGKTPLHIALENPVMCRSVKMHVVQGLLSNPALQVNAADMSEISKLFPEAMLSLLEQHRSVFLNSIKGLS